MLPIIRRRSGQSLSILIVLCCAVFVLNQKPSKSSTSMVGTPTVVADPLSNQFEIFFDKSSVVLPCACMLDDPIRLPYELRDPRTLVSVTTNTAVRSPLTYRYEVSAGKILYEGPNVIWDFSDVPPGEYEVKVTVTDALDPVGKTATKSVPVAYASCHCPCFCPTIIVESNLSSVRRGDIVKYGANVNGGDFSRMAPGYTWKVSNGTIVSGQGTDHITVIAKSGRDFSNVQAEVEVSGTDPSCNCPITARGSIPVGTKTIPEKHDSNLRAMWVHETNLIGPGKYGYSGCGEHATKDMITDVSLDIYKLGDESQYRYAVTGGKVKGAGTKVSWDLTGVAPGSYTISVGEFRNGKQVGETKSATITVTYELSNCDPFCPVFTIEGVEHPIKAGEKLSVSASASRGVQDAPFFYNWIVSSGEIVSGQGSSAILINVPDAKISRDLNVTLNVGGIDPRWGCPVVATKRFLVEPNL